MKTSGDLPGRGSAWEDVLEPLARAAVNDAALGEEMLLAMWLAPSESSKPSTTSTFLTDEAHDVHVLADSSRVYSQAVVEVGHCWS